MKVVTSADFEAEVLKSDKPVLIDFYADWCGPCRQIAPVLEQIAAENPTVKIVKVNIDASPELAAKYAVQSIPNLMIVRDGKVIAKRLGAAPKTALTQWINEAAALPAGTPDLTPKTVKLSDGDKQRLRDAFAAAVNNSPEAERPALRTAINQGIDATFKNIEGILSAERATLDQVVEQIKHTKYSLQGPKG